MVKSTDIVECSRFLFYKLKKIFILLFSLKAWEKKKTVKAEYHLEEIQTSFERGFIYQIVAKKEAKYSAQLLAHGKCHTSHALNS